MKRVNKKQAVTIAAILILLVGTIAGYLLNYGKVAVSLKSEYASFVGKEGIITEVEFHVPANFNAVQLDSESKTSRDVHGNEYLTLTYKGIVKKAFFASIPTVTINRENTYVFVFLDKTVTIADGKITDSLSK